jgi:hypothetical protein
LQSAFDKPAVICSDAEHSLRLSIVPVAAWRDANGHAKKEVICRSRDVQGDQLIKRLGDNCLKE